MRFGTTAGLALALGLAGCDDALFPGGEPAPTGTGWCATLGMIDASCLGCHSAASALGGLDLETDPHGALVGVTSAAYGGVLVDPGSPDTSLLVRKIEGTQTASEGGPMPPTGAVDAAVVDAVKQWITDGADAVCDTIPTGGRYHPEDWALPTEHGMGAKFGSDNCLACHGEDLSGGTAGIACDDCHVAGWETTCTFCHGDPATGVAAPPEDIDDNADPATISFPGHPAHLSSPMHATWDCGICHVKPASALDPGHLFVDATPGQAEVAFTGVAAGGTYNAGSCGSLYCHGNGRVDGSVDVADTVACGDCHAVQASGLASWLTMSGAHSGHLENGVTCAECHPDAATDGTLADGAPHVDGDVDIALPVGMTYAGTCTGTCHAQRHNAASWVGDL